MAAPTSRTLPWSGNYRPPETYYAVGQYYALAGKSPFGRHIYPMPDGAWLGLHVTVDIGGRCKFGPDIEWIPEIEGCPLHSDPLPIPIVGMATC